jgi:cell division topological specificity factor
MPEWFERISGKKESSANQAKERLKLVLIHDRTDITPGMLEKLKNDLLAVIGKYVEIDSSAIRIDISQDGREQRLVADVPIVTSTSQRKRVH